MNNNITRHKIRIIALQVLFALDLNSDNNINNLYNQLLNNKEIPSYLLKLVNGVNNNIDELDYLIQSYLKPGWTIQRLSKIDLIVLRLAFYELKYENVPFKVVIDEYLKLINQFSNSSSKKFINGVLGNFVGNK